MASPTKKENNATSRGRRSDREHVINPAQVRSELGLTDREMDLSRSQTWLRRRIFSTFSHVKQHDRLVLQLDSLNDHPGLCGHTVHVIEPA